MFRSERGAKLVSTREARALRRSSVREERALRRSAKRQALERSSGTAKCAARQPEAGPVPKRAKVESGLTIDEAVLFLQTGRLPKPSKPLQQAWRSVWTRVQERHYAEEPQDEEPPQAERKSDPEKRFSEPELLRLLSDRTGMCSRLSSALKDMVLAAIKDAQQNPECPICLEPQKTALLTLPCSARICAECLGSCAESCYMCRQRH